MRNKITIVIFFSFLSLSAQKIPKWFSTGNVKGYTSENYLLGFGVGATLNESISKAQEQIASQINAEISSELNVIEREVTSNNHTISSADVHLSIKININQSISGTTVIKQEFIGGKFYTAVGLYKALYVSSMVFRLQELEETANILYSQAEKGLKSGRLEVYYANKDIYKQTLLDLSSAAGILRSFGNPSIFTVDKTFNQIIGNVSELNLAVESGNKQTVVLGFLFKDPVVVKASMNYEGHDVPLANIQLRTKGISPKEILVWTNGNGIANFRLPANFSDETAKSIQIEVVKSRLPNNGKDFPEASPINLHFAVVDENPITFDLEINDEVGSDKSVTKTKKNIIKTITGLGHFIAPNDKLLLRNTITIEDSKEVEGKDGTMFLVTGELFVELISLENNKVIATLSIESKGMDKQSEIKALEKAIKNMKLSRRNFSKILDEAKGELIAIMTIESEYFLKMGKSDFNLRHFNKAMENLSKVHYGDNFIAESNKLIEDIRLTIQREDEKRIERELAENERERQVMLDAERMRIEAIIQIEKAKIDSARTK